MMVSPDIESGTDNQWITGEGTESARKLSSSSGSRIIRIKQHIVTEQLKITAPTCSSISCRGRELLKCQPALSGSE